jgi:hypothetical protein
METFNKLINALYAARIGCKLILDMDDEYTIVLGRVSQRIHDSAMECATKLGINEEKVSTCADAHIPRIKRVQTINGGPKEEEEHVPSHLRHLPKSVRKFYR